MNHIRYNNELFQHYNDNKFNLFNFVSNNNVNEPNKKLKEFIGPMELITYPGRIQSWLGIKKSFNIDNFVWIKITNSHEDESNDLSPHYFKGFYVSIIGEESTLLIQYNDPISTYELNGIINMFNKIQYIKHFNFIINIIEKILKRKPDFIDQNI
jgi:hypothetical protein